jgi:hypothetical protein
MQYGSFGGGGLPPYGMAADGGGGSSIRSSSAPAFDLTAAHKGFHLVSTRACGAFYAARPASFRMFCTVL